MRVTLAVATILLGTTMTAQGQLVAFSTRLEPETIKGAPQFVRIETMDRPNDSDSGPFRERHLQETTTYQATGLVAERVLYSSDGSLSYRFTYDYAPDGRLIAIRTFDAAGQEVQQSSFSLSGDVQEKVVTTPAGIVDRQRTTKKLDGAGRVVESTSTNLSKDSQTRQTLEYNADGQVVREEIALEGRPRGVARIEAVRRPDGRIVATGYSSDGKIVSKAETYESETRRESSQTLFVGGTTSCKTTIEEIVSWDELGNWTQKTIRERAGKSQGTDSITVVYRTISYY